VTRGAAETFSICGYESAGAAEKVVVGQAHLQFDVRF